MMSLLLKDRMLSDCPPDKAFWTIKGNILRNIYELINVLQSMDEWTFKYHINRDNNKNDFADWIRDVFGDDELATKLEGVVEKNKYLDIINRRVKELENTSS